MDAIPMSLDAHTRLYCIFGRPVRHSLSPVMHNRAFSELGLNAAYLAFEPASAAEAAHAMRSLDIGGASVTIPYKIDMLGQVDRCDPLAEAIGSLNTIVNEQGCLVAYNTDGIGALRALTESGITVGGSTVLILGNGGSARAIAFTMLEEGARVIVAGRNRDRVSGLAAELVCRRNNAEGMAIDDCTPSLMATVTIIINTTPVGMAPDTASIPLPPELLESHHTVFDIVYHPDRTRLLAEAEKRGCATVRGAAMLVHQGARQFELWTGINAPVDAMRRALESHLYERSR